MGLEAEGVSLLVASMIALPVKGTDFLLFIMYKT